MLARGAGKCENIVERHRYVGDDYLPGRLQQSLRPGLGSTPRIHGPSAPGMLKLAPHFPAYPEKDDPARKQQTYDFQKLNRESREHDPQNRRCDNPDEIARPRRSAGNPEPQAQ